MELVDGGSLKALPGPDRRLPFPITRRIIREVLQALAHLHGVDVLHRDLSPCNILISTSGSVKVADLGIARVMEQGQTCTKNYRGKPAYDSPEALQGLTLDARSDLYTLGAVLYELLAGTPPCGEAVAFGDVVKRTLCGDFAPLPPDAPADLAVLAMGLLRIDREAREPQTATGALALLRRRDQPMASQAELAALVMDRKSRRGAEPDGAHRAPSLAPGEMQEPGDELVARTDPEPGEPMPDAVPVQLLAPAQPLVFPLPPEPPLPPLPQPPPRTTAMVPGHVPASRMAAESKQNSSSSGTDAPGQASGGERRFPLRAMAHAAFLRAADLAVTAACVLVLVLLLAGGFRGELDAFEPQQAPRWSAPVAECTQVAPALVPVVPAAPDVPGETTAPRRASQRAAGWRGKPAQVRSGSRVVGGAPARRRPVPHASEPPPWARR